jgi:hypothetical protein
MSVNSPFAEKAGSFLGNFMIPAAAVLGSVVAFAVFSGKKNHSHAEVKSTVVQPVARTIPARQAVPIVKKKSPLISKINPAVTPEEPVLEPKAVVPVVVAPQVEAELPPEIKSVPAVEAVPEIQTVPEIPSVVAKEDLTAEQTFEQYRQAMLHSGPRDMEYQARAEMQSKGGMGNNAMWRTQTASLRKSLHKDVAIILDEMNVSINDRVVSDFTNVRDV